MKSIKIFISSVQAEFSKERVQLCDYIRRDALLGRFFEPFLFEELPAINESAVQVYLPEVERCDIYLGLLGNFYGNEDSNGISPTEKEYDAATVNCKHRLLFIKKSSHDERHPKEQQFIRKVEGAIVRKSFIDFEELRSAVYAALVHYLSEKEYLRILPFDAAYNTSATIKDIDNEKVATFVGVAKEKRGLPLPTGSSVETVLTHLDLVTSEGKISNAALLLFGKQPPEVFHQL